ncbi:MAG: hypothetical protein P4L55_19695 [Syntrophobacteraceae bacterium]|nr:hypothetical protein [Syntrophobacteraceae bacterium]
MLSKASIRKAIVQARGCVKGDLYLDDGGKSVSFVVGTTDSLDYGRIYPDFWFLAKEHTVEKVAGIILRWAASR